MKEEVILEEPETITGVKQASKTRHLKKKKASETTTEQEPATTTSSQQVKKKKSKKKSTTAVESISVSKTKSSTTADELKQGEHIIDYDKLQDALSKSFCLDDRHGDIHFAPLVTKNKQHNKSSETSSSRTCNRNPPTAKNRHAEIPPPSFMTNTRLGKKKSFDSDKSIISKIKEKKVKPLTEKKESLLESQSVIVSLPTPKNKQVSEVKTESNSDERRKERRKEKNREKKERKKKERNTEAKQEIQQENSSKPKVKKEPNGSKSEIKKEYNDIKQESVESNREIKAEAVESKREIKQKVKQDETQTKSKEKRRERRKEKREEEKKLKKSKEAQEYCHPNDIIRGKSRVRFEPYIDPRICTIKVKEGKYYKGIIRINKRNRADAYVTCENLDADIFINGQHDRNRALDGDTVIVELLDLETIWAKKKESIIQKREQRHITAAERPPPEEGEEDKGKPKYVGKVVHISATDKRQTCSGTLSLQQRFTENEPSDTKNVRLAWFKPVDPRTPLIAIQLRYAPKDLLTNEEKYKNLLMVAKITRWPIDSSNPFGTVVRELGHIGNIPAETEAVLADNKIIERPFGQKALNGLPEVPWSIKQSDIDKRRDLRNTRIFTIDPATAKDLDDAVHITKLKDDEYEVGVHIADVSHFINQHTELDHEAYDRGTSTYLCDRVIPMLPSLLCEELCSLNPGVERLAFSVIWKMDGAGNIKETWFGKSVIKSCAKLAYEDAQNVIEGKGLPSTVSIKEYTTSQVEQDIQYLFKISKQMRERRFSNGALSINSIRLSFKLNEIGEPYEVSIYEQKDANRLIEEFMLCANMSVAQKISQHYPNEALLRQHSPPHEKSLNEFIKIADNLGYQIDCSSAGSIQESFNKIENQDIKAVLQLLAVKPMQRAKYFCTGSTDIKKFRHYALNVPLYTHFTSPIRRFADIIVHRQLQAALLGKENCGYKKTDIQKAAAHCNERKEGAKNSQDMNIQLYLSHYLHMVEEKTKKPVICSAIVTHVLKDCFEILVPEYGLEKRIHMDALPIERFVFDPHKIALSVYWKEGIESNREWDQSRKLDEDYVEPSGIQLYLDQDPNDEENASKSIYKIPEELLSDNLIDHEKKMQRFEAFSKINVRIQVNVERSPPIVNIYPVNPFN